MGTVYFINGFLDAVKTSFIKDLISRESFQIPDKTLLLVCEEGEEEYDSETLSQANAVIEYIEKEEDFTEEHIKALEQCHNPERVMVEFNGMWNRKDLQFPAQWDDIMEIAIFDASTFKLFADNMRPNLAEQAKHAELVVFYKADEVRNQLATYARNIKASNPDAAYVFRSKEGDIVLTPDELLPYDLQDEELELTDVGFSTLCMDALERCELYEGKKVHFTAQVYPMKEGGDLEFIAGRVVVTCCEADTSFMGIICGYPKAYELNLREWVEIRGIIRIVYDDIMGRDIPVCRVIDLKKVPQGSEFVYMI
jgi:uncharacterized membrane protein YcgQ (UPF0703/DUF1980 family)